MKISLARGVEALCITLALSGCASIDGPSPVVTAAKGQSANDTYINGDVLGAFYSPDATKRSGMSPLQWRNTVVGAQLDAADQNYAAYASALRSERSRLALGSDLVVVGLSEGASLAKKATANALAAASAGIVGANAAINKDAYYNATVEALISQMDAERATVRAQINKAMANSETAYPLANALGDVRRYEAAGTMDRAITKMNAAASAAKTIAEANLDLVRNSHFLETEDAVAKLLSRVAALTDTQALNALNIMKTKLKERSQAVQQNVTAIVPGLDKIADGVSAKKAMQAWLTLDDRAPDLQKEWSDALDIATK